MSPHFTFTHLYCFSGLILSPLLTQSPASLALLNPLLLSHIVLFAAPVCVCAYKHVYVYVYVLLIKPQVLVAKCVKCPV